MDGSISPVSFLDEHMYIGPKTKSKWNYFDIYLSLIVSRSAVPFDEFTVVQVSIFGFSTSPDKSLVRR